VTGPSFDDRGSISARNLDRQDEVRGPVRSQARGIARDQAQRPGWEDDASDDDRRGRRLGPIQITPTKVILAVAVAGSIGFGLYTVTVRDAN
jgi:hypothetical protein